MKPKRFFILSFLLFFSLALSTNVGASKIPAEQSSLFAPSGAITGLQLSVELRSGVYGETEAFDTVNITLKDGGGVIKATGSTSSDTNGDFLLDCSDWSGSDCPDIQPGDVVEGTTGSGHSSNVKVGRINGKLDPITDVVTGEINANWISGSVNVRCEVRESPGPAPINTTVDPDGGTYTCDFGDVGWDLQIGDQVAVMYFENETDPDAVIRIITWPWMRVNYANDWVGGAYEAGHTFTINVTDDIGALKATAVIDSQPGVGWGDDGFDTSSWHWTPSQPDIQPGDYVYFQADDGYSNSIHVGTISGVLDVNDDSVSGHISVPWLSGELAIECQPWGAWDDGIDAPSRNTWAGVDGDPLFTCSWNPISEWDIVPGQAVAVMYTEDDLDTVIDVYNDGAPHLHIQKVANGTPGVDGNLSFQITYWNDGDAPAENVTITDTMVGLNYISDTSGLPHTGTGTGPIVWDVGTVDPGGSIEFSLFTEITASESSTVSNTVEIQTSNPYDRGNPAEKISEWQETILANDTQLQIEKNAWTTNPASEQAFIWTVVPCNHGTTSSSDVTLTDTIPDSTSLLNWWSQEEGWEEVSVSASEIVLSFPSLSNGSCSEIHFRFQVDPEAYIGEYISNTASVESSDHPGELREVTDGVEVGYPQANLSIDKSWSHGLLYPGGKIHFLVRYENDGNIPVENITITDTLPINTSLYSIAYLDHFGGYVGDVTPSTVSASMFTVDISSLENGFAGFLDVTLVIDPDATPGISLTNTVAISCVDDETTCADNTSSASENLFSHGTHLRVRKSHEWQDNKSALLYEITFENVGDDLLTNVSLTDTYPDSTTFTGFWGHDYWKEISYIGHDAGASSLQWEISQIEPGTSGTIWFSVSLDDPTELMSWFTNVVEIEIDPGEVNPGDNFYEDVAFNGGEINSVHLFVDTDASQMWGNAVPDSVVSVTTAHSQYFASAEADCGGCWSIENAGPVMPGDSLTVEIVSGLHPVTIVVPDPFTAQGDSMSATVFGQIDSLDNEWVEGHLGLGLIVTGKTDASGNYLLTFPTYLDTDEGFVRYSTWSNYAEIHFYMFFQDYLRIYLPIVMR